MRILVLTQVFPPRTGGSGRWLWELYRRLRDAADVHVIAGATEGADAFDRAAGAWISRLPLDFSSWGVLHVRSARAYASALLAVRDAVRRFQPDVIHCGKSLQEGLLALAVGWLSGVPYLAYVHGEELTLSAGSRELSYLTRRVLRRARLVIANSQHTRRLLVDFWSVPAEKIHVMHPGVDTNRFVPAPPNSDVRARLGWTDRRVILTVGALQKRKGQDMVIRSLAAIRRQCPDVLYAIVGEGWEKPYLQQTAQECGVADAVQFRGVPGEDELIECYQQCDVFALANRQVGWDFEGFGIVLLEAQACGRPVVTGRSGGTPETIQPGLTGETVACDTPNELSAALLSLLDDPERRARFGAEARRWVSERFSWGVVIDEARNVFTKCGAAPTK